MSSKHIPAAATGTAAPGPGRAVHYRSPRPITRKTLLWTSTVCFLAWVFSVYDYTLFGTLLPKIADTYHWSAAHSTALATYVTTGTFVVSLCIGPMLDYFGRKKALIVTSVGAALTSGLTGLTGGALSLVLIRSLSGLGSSEEVVNTVYLNEMYEAGGGSRRGFMYSFVQSGWPIGAMLSAGLSAVLLPVVGWRGTFLVATFPALVIVALGSRLRESPVFENIREVRRLRKEGEQREADALAAESGLDPHEKAGLRAVFSRELRWHTLSLSAAWLFNWVGIQVFSVLGTTVLVGAKHVSFSNALLVLILANLAGALGYLTHGWIGDRVGRRTTIIVGWLIGAIVTVLMLVGPSNSVYVIVMYALALFFLTGPYSAMLFYMGESYPARLRGIGTNTSHLMGPVGAIVGSAALTALLSAGLSMVTAALLTGSLGMFLSVLAMFGTRRLGQPDQTSGHPAAAPAL